MSASSPRARRSSPRISARPPRRTSPPWRWERSPRTTSAPGRGGSFDPDTGVRRDDAWDQPARLLPDDSRRARRRPRAGRSRSSATASARAGATPRHRQPRSATTPAWSSASPPCRTAGAETSSTSSTSSIRSRRATTSASRSPTCSSWCSMVRHADRGTVRPGGHVAHPLLRHLTRRHHGHDLHGPRACRCRSAC